MFKWLPVLAALCVAGCFNEPEPAYKTVPAGARVYLQDKELKTAPLPENPQIVDYINLDRNSLTNIDALAALDGLKWLRLNDNRLSSLPDLGRLVKLRRIVLVERDDISDSVYGIDSEFIIGEEPAAEDSELISDFDILPDSKSEEVNTHAD